MTVCVDEIAKYINDFLDVNKFKDYCPNGIQVKGTKKVNTIVSGVSANLELFKRAKLLQADLILVHHGLFWHKQSPTLIGPMYDRAKFLLEDGASLLAYHLPLDAHMLIGNNALLAKALNAKVVGSVGVGVVAELAHEVSSDVFSAKLHQILQRKALVFGNNNIKTFGLCSGAAQHEFINAINLGLDAYITGEVSEFVPALAKESGVSYFAAGHHATEVFGVKALGQHLAEKFHLQHDFIDISNSV